MQYCWFEAVISCDKLIITGLDTTWHTETLTGCTLWKRLCFIEIQQTSTGCFADLGNRNRAWILFNQPKKQILMAVFVRTTKTTDSFNLRPSQTNLLLGNKLWNRTVSVFANLRKIYFTWSSDFQKCWYMIWEVEGHLEFWGRIWTGVQVCFCAQGWLFDSSSSRRSRTSVMKQGWPQLHLSAPGFLKKNNPALDF